MKVITKTLNLNDTTVFFKNSNNGLEEFYHGDKCLSSKKSLFGGKHEFILKGIKYTIKVSITPNSKIVFKVTADGKVIMKPKSQLPTIFYIIGGSLFFSGFRQIYKRGSNPEIYLLLIGVFVLGGIFLGLGAYFQFKKQKNITALH